MAGGTSGSQRCPNFEARLDEIHEREKELAEMRQKKGPFDRAVRTATTNIRESYEVIIFENLATSEPVEQQLWRLHYSFIEEFRGRLGKLKVAAVAAANNPNKKKAVEEQKFQRVGGQYKCFLDEATGFYHGLIAKLRAKLGLPPDISSANNTSGKSSINENFQLCHSVCYRCFIYVGDLARYRELHSVVEGRAADWSLAASYYRQASTLWPAGGNPHNQLGVLATYAGDNLQAVYYYLYSLAVPIPFGTARANIKLLFEKNQHHVEQLSSSPEEDRAIDLQMAQAFDSDAFKSSNGSHRDTADEPQKLSNGSLVKLQRRFCVHFISLVGFLLAETGLDEINKVLTLTIQEAHILLSQNHALVTPTFIPEKAGLFKNQAFSILQLVIILILSVHNVGHKKDNSFAPSGTQRLPLVGHATKAAFQFISQLMHHAASAEQPFSCHLFPAVVVFCKWLASHSDLIEQIRADEECDRLQCTFWKEACVLLSRCLKNSSISSGSSGEKVSYSKTDAVLWEDKELGGLIPLSYLECEDIVKIKALALKGGNAAFEPDCLLRVQRLLSALKSLSCLFKVDSQDFELITAVNKSSLDCTNVRLCPFEWFEGSHASGGSEGLADESMEVKTQGPQIVDDNITEKSLLSHCKKEDRLFMQKMMSKCTASLYPPSDECADVLNLQLVNKRIAQSAGVVERDFVRDQRLDPVSPSQADPVLSFSKNKRGMPGVSLQQGIVIKEISQDSLTRESSRTTSHQPEEVASGNNLESILEDPICNASEQTEALTSCPLGRGALSLGDWVKPQSGSHDHVGSSSAYVKKNLSLFSELMATEQAQNVESLVPSLSFIPVSICKTSTLFCSPFSSEIPPPTAGALRDVNFDCNTDKSQSPSVAQHENKDLTRILSEQNNTTLDCEGAQSRDLGVRSSKEVVIAWVKPGEDEMESEEHPSKTQNNLSIKPLDENPVHNLLESRVDVGRAQDPGGRELSHEVNFLPSVTKKLESVEVAAEDGSRQQQKQKHASQSMPKQPAQIYPDGLASFEHLDDMQDDTTRHDHEEEDTGHGSQAVKVRSGGIGYSLKVLMETPINVVENNGVISLSKKRKYDKLTSHPNCVFRSSLCPNCVVSSPMGDGVDRAEQDEMGCEELANILEKDDRGRGVNETENCKFCASQNMSRTHAPHQSFADSGPFYPDGRPLCSNERIDWPPLLKNFKKQQGKDEDDYSWLDTYTHVIPQGLTELAILMSKTAFSFSDFGMLCEYGANS